MKRKSLDHADKLAKACAIIMDYLIVPSLIILFCGADSIFAWSKASYIAKLALGTVTAGYLFYSASLPSIWSFAENSFLMAYGKTIRLFCFAWTRYLLRGVVSIIITASTLLGKGWVFYFFIIATIANLLCVLTLLGLGRYWRILSKRKPSEAEMVDDFLKSVTPESIPAGMVMRLDLRTGEKRTYPIDFDPKAVLDDPSTIILSREAIKTTSEADTETVTDEHQNT